MGHGTSCFRSQDPSWAYKHWLHVTWDWVLGKKIEANVALYLRFWHTSDLIFHEQGVRTVSKLCFSAHDRNTKRIFKWKSKERWSK